MDGSKSMAARLPVGTGLTPEEWTRAQQVFLDILEQPPEQRVASARALCEDVTAVFDTVVRLLAGHEEENGVFGPPPEPRLTLPLMLGSYRLVEEIGRGGMGAVCRAERADGQFEKQVAVKLLAGDLVTPRSIERFRKERQILAGLEHPYIARLLDGGLSEDGVPYIVMEYVGGIPVDRYRREQALGVRETVQLYVKICDAVEYAHAHGIVHRDIKPGNLIVTPDGTPKLLDFGISLLLDQASEQSAPGEERTRAATPHYASPEQLNGWTATPASDVYSLGILLRDLLARHDGSHRISRDLEAIIGKATADQPGGRYASARELREDLDRYLLDLPVAARRESLTPRLSRFLTRHRWQAAVSLLLAICIVAAATVRHQARVATDRKIQAVLAIRGLFWETQKQISTLTGSRDSQRRLIQETVSQLEVLGSDAGDDPALLYELAMSYSIVAYSQAANAFVGDFSDATHAYERAIGWGERALRRSGTVRARLLLAALFANASNNQLWNADYAAAERLTLAGQSVLDEARPQLLQADSGGFYRTMMSFLDARGEAVEAQGRIGEARRLWMQADALADRLPQSNQNGFLVRASIRIMLAVSNCEAGDIQAGSKYAGSAETLARGAAQRDPRLNTGAFYKALRAAAECDLVSGRIQEARARLELVRNGYHKSSSPESPWVRTGLADADRILGSLLLKSGEFRAAAAVYQDGLDALSSPPEFARSRIAESNRAVLLAGRGRLQQIQSSSSPSNSPVAARYWRAACDDYRRADTVLREWATNRGIDLSSRLAMAEVEKELPKCSDSRGIGN
jgi:serine/threonine protein kinase